MSLLRYPGGKTRAIKILKEFIPPNTKELCSPFFGGGSFEIYCANELNIKVYGYDFFKPLVAFWKYALEKPNILACSVEKCHPIDKESFHKYRETLTMTKSVLTMATNFFVLNRSSFSGTTLSGGFSPEAGSKRFTLSSIERIRKFKCPNLTVKWMHFKDSIPLHPDTLLYLDPPYMLDNSKLYGTKGDLHEGFDHNMLFDILNKRKNWILSYNNHPEIVKKYSNYKITNVEWSYGMSSDKNSKEILITSL